ncbi:MAG TPA: BadF/BadG/BcrA/BcrD ATPase family protein, partial [Terriglobia bacterium]|nr:BadF/BadG/BcrA/BcrD ATPase family protein [Terriglobia bacterium]
TKSILADASARVLGVGRGGPAIHLKDGATREHARRVLQEAIHGALEKAGLPDTTEIACAFLGFSGVSGPEAPAAKTYCEVVQEQFAVRSILIDHDARTALAGAIPSMAGVVAIAGTGSIAFAMNARGSSARAGGWGYLLGDPGSAYEIGRQALAAVALAHDGAGPSTLLSSLLLQALEIHQVSEITQAVYRDVSPKLRIASVCSTVAAAAASGDEVAISIFEQAGHSLGSMACAAARKLIPLPSLMFSGVGGVFESGDLLWRPYREAVLSEYSQAQVVSPAFPPLVGALILALRHVQGDASEESLDRIRRSYDSLQSY